MKKQNNLKRAIVVFLILVTCISMMSVTASAATSGSTNSRTIYVRTTANWSRPGSESITLRQNKCKYSYQKMSWFRWVTKTASMYPNYTIKIKHGYQPGNDKELVKFVNQTEPGQKYELSDHGIV